MAEISDKLVHMRIADIIGEFRAALVALAPALIRLDILSSDSEHYDDFDAIAERLWDVLVCRSLAWKFGLPHSPRLNRYGFEEVGQDGVLQLLSGTEVLGVLVGFIGNRSFGPELFNAVVVSAGASPHRHVPWSPDLEVQWVMPGGRIRH